MRTLLAAKTYKVTVPKDVPVNQFWSLIVYDQATFAFIYNPLRRAGLSTFDLKKMKKNNDGSVTIYLGPKAPAGLGSNWIPTKGKEPMPLLFFQIFYTITFRFANAHRFFGSK